MLTLTHTYTDGTRATYTVAPGSDMPLRLAALKPAKRPPLARSEKRLFPRWHAGMSTAEYVRKYYAANTGGQGGGTGSRLTAYDRPDYVDHLALYAPLNEAPCAVYTELDTVEHAE